MPHQWLHAIADCDGRDVCLRGSEPGPSEAARDPGPVQEEGDRLVARQEADRLVLEKPVRIKRRLKAHFAQVLGASALLAYLREEPGAEMVQTAMKAEPPPLIGSIEPRRILPLQIN